MKQKFLTFILVFLCLVVATQQSSASSATTARGKYGQVLKTSKALNLNPSGTWVTVTGSNFDERIGIYVTYCKIVKKGQLATPCGAGIDMTGSTHTSVWVSSNAPFLLRPLITEYGAGGTFKVRIKVIAKVGDIDCTKYKCAITTRSDHLNLDSHRNDVFIPITFAKKGTK